MRNIPRRNSLQIAKRVARQKRLEREALVGKPRAKSWGGKRYKRQRRIEDG